MPITDPLVLPVDVTITPVTELARATRARLTARDGEYAVTRRRGRVPTRIVSEQAARLLERFRDPQPVSSAVIGYAGDHGLDAKELLRDAFPLLRDCFNSRFLVPAGSPEAAPTLPTRERGDRIGRYTVLRCLHVLEDTELWQARTARGQLVAVKLLRPGASRSATRSLTREAATLRHLDGMGAPEFLAAGRHQGQRWIAMTWLEGVAPEIACAELAEMHPKEGRRMLRRLVARIARAYADLHQAGVLHGDIHPNNLLVSRDGRIALLDFGLARPIPPLRLGGAAGRGGIAFYFAPEQAAVLARRDLLPPPTPASEQYAVAALLYRLLTGDYYLDFSFDRETMLRQVMEHPPRPFSRTGTAPWPAMEEILGRALAKAPGDRFPSLAAFARAVGRAALPRVPKRRRAAPGGTARFTADFLARVGLDAPAFRDRGLAPTGSLMLGRTGIAYAIYRLASGTGGPRLLALADAWITRIERDIARPDTFEDRGTVLVAETLGPVSPYHSETGVHLVRALVALAQGDTALAESAVTRFIAAAERPWNGNDLTMGQAGVLLAATALYEAARDTADIANPLLTLGKKLATTVWRDRHRQPGNGANPGMAHGLAGILHVTMRWCRATGEPLPASFRAELDRLAGRAEPLGRGLHWAQPDAGEVPSVWAVHQVAGWCNGPSGFIHLFTQAADTFGDSAFLSLAESAAWSSWEARSDLPDLCCGLAGRSYGLLNFYRSSGDTAWLERARRLAVRACDGYRATGDSLPRPLSLYKGMAGIALLASEVERAGSAGFPLTDPEGWPA